MDKRQDHGGDRLRYDYRWQEIYSNFGRRATEIVEGGIHTYSNVTGVLGLIYELSPEVAVAANVGRAWRPPGVNELYSHGVHHGTAQFEVGDKELETEASVNTDLTLRYQGERRAAVKSGYSGLSTITSFRCCRPTISS